MAALAFLCAAAAGAPALAADAVQTRAYHIEGGTRLVFDWPAPVEFVTTVSGTRLTVSFDRPLAATFGDALATLGAAVSDIQIGGNGQTVVVTLAAPAFVTSFAHEDLVVVDLMELDPAQPEQAAASPAADAAPAPGAIAQSPSRPEEPAPTAASDTPPAPPAQPPTSQPSSPPAPVVAEADAGSAGLISPDEVPIAPAALDPGAGTQQAAQAPQPAPGSQAAGAPPSGTQGYVPPAAPVIVDGVLSVRYGLHDTYDRIVFDWPERVPYSVETNNGIVRIHFDAEARIDADRLAARLPDSRLRLVSAETADGALDVVLAASPGARVQDFYNLTKTVVDVYRDPTGAPPAEATPEALVAASEPAPAAEEPAEVAMAEPAAEAQGLSVPPPALPPEVRSDAPPPASSSEAEAGTELAEPAPETPMGDAAAVAEATDEHAPEAAFGHEAEVAAEDEHAPTASPEHGAEVAAAPAPAAPAHDEETPAAGHEPGHEPERVAQAHGETPEPADAESPGAESAGAETHGAETADAAAGAPEEALDGQQDQGAAPEATAEVEVREPGQLEIVVIGGETETLMRLRWSVPARAAVVKRGDRVWVSFDRPAEGFSLTPLTDPMDDEIRPLYDDPTEVETEGGLVFNVRVPAAIEPRVTATGNTWYIQLRPRSTELTEALAAQRFEDPVLGPAIAYAVEDPGKPVDMVDPVIGDRFVVVPSGAPGVGVPEGASFVQFATLATAQGLAFERLSDDVLVRRQNDRIEVVASGGLTLSDDQAVRDALDRAAAPEHAEASGHPEEDAHGAPEHGAAEHAAAPAVDAHGAPVHEAEGAYAAADTYASPPRGGAGGDFRLFEPEVWRDRHHGSFDSVRRELQEAAARARTPEDRADARAEFARYLFARGQYRDAGGILRLIDSETPEKYAQDSSLLALRGATAFMNGELEDALGYLSDRRLTPSAEAQYWRAAALVRLGYEDDAADVYANHAEAPDWYDRELSIPLAIAEVDAALAMDDVVHASVLLDRLPYFGLDRRPAAEIALRRADALARGGDMAGADDQWDDVIATRLEGPSARAVLARTRAHYDAGELEPAAAAAALDAVRFAWRGGDFELDLLRQMAEYQFDAGDYRSGIQTLRHARALFADHRDTPLVEERMQQAFTALFGPEPPINVSPITAIALFSEFQDLAPEGEERTGMLRRLAGRLVAIGLDSDAADVLGTLLDTDMNGSARAALGRDLAILYLADRAPARAVEALMGTRSARIDEALAADRRHLLASARLAEEDYAEVLATLDGDLGREASMLRAEANWRLGDWDGAAQAFGRLVEGDAFAWPPVPGARAPLSPAADTAAMSDEEGVAGEPMAGEPMAGEPMAGDAMAEGAVDLPADDAGLPPLMSAEEAAAMDSPDSDAASAPALMAAADGFAPYDEALDDRTAEQVLNWAMALTYAEDATGLAYLRDVYGPAMNDTPYGATFRLLTASDLGPIDSVADLGRIGTNIDLFSRFLDSYRERLAEELAPEDTGASPAAMDAAEAPTG